MKLERYSVCIRAGDSEKAKAVENAINNVPDIKLKRILTMRYLNGWTWQKVGYVYGLAEASVRIYARRHCQAYELEL